MKTTLKSIAAIAMLTSLLFIGCKKAEKGEAGTPGKDGKDGNANVTSAILNVSNWTWDNNNKWNYATWSNVSILNSDVVNGGAVMLYEGSSGNWLAMPYTLGLGSSSNITFNVNFEYAINSVKVYKGFSDGTNYTEPASQFKLVCIPKSAKVMHPNVNLYDYNEVKEAFDIE